MAEINISVSTKTILKIMGILLLFVSLILAALIDPLADWLQKKKIPRALAVILIYVILLGFVASAILILVPIITQDLPALLGNLERFWGDLQTNDLWLKVVGGLESAQNALNNYGLVIEEGTGAVGSGVGNTLSGVFSTITGFFGGLISLLIVLVMTFYMVVQDDPIKKMLRSLVPDEYIPWCSQLLSRMRNKLGAWLRGQLILSILVGLLVFLGLSLLQIKYAAILAILAGLLEFVPYVGPVFAAIPALFLGFSQAGIVKMLLVLLMYIVLQQLENHILVPKVMQKAVGLNPIVSIIALLAGAQLAGFIGVLIAIPVATALSVFIEDVLAKDRKN